MMIVKSIKIGEEAFFLFSLKSRSLLAHEDEISTCLDNFAFNFDVISLTESWLQDDNKELADMNRYVSFHSLRSDKGGGWYIRICEGHISC